MYLYVLCIGVDPLFLEPDCYIIRWLRFIIYKSHLDPNHIAVHPPNRLSYHVTYVTFLHVTCTQGRLLPYLAAALQYWLRLTSLRSEGGSGGLQCPAEESSIHRQLGEGPILWALVLVFFFGCPSLLEALRIAFCLDVVKYVEVFNQTVFFRNYSLDKRLAWPIMWKICLDFDFWRSWYSTVGWIKGEN